MWLPPILKRFRQLYPNVRIDIKEGGNREMTRWLNEMSVDCCFFCFPLHTGRNIPRGKL
ncbi:LysR family transcriptional regulator substrate-binding protein [Enterocloster clostridioformis]|uniref:LysR family transcriptional regulator substrate-binding protein n=1 Tax=Enterocloster clostridioformis TaxID=1531 RepID=UPI000A63481C|nr:LysR family transcriptional regulator substrate-binding protein [Enterocloster clostridioformis]